MSRTAAALVIGNEILSGKIADTNTTFLARGLFELGIELRRVVVCPDEVETISKELTELRIAATSVDSLPFMAILQVAADKGWCEEEGLDVSFISGSGGGNTLRTVSTGDADIAITGGPAVVLAQQQSPDALKLIGSWFQVNDFYFIGPE